MTAPSQIVFKKVSSFLLKTKNITSAIGMSLMSTEKGETSSLKHKILLMMSSVDPEDSQTAC